MLGSDLAGVLSAEPHHLNGVGRRPAPHLKIPYQIGDVSRPGLLQKIAQQIKPEIILHAAAMTEVDECETHRREALQGNLETTRYVTEAANACGALVVLFSTDFVFDGTKKGPYLEEDVPRPISIYGETKLLAERYVMVRAKEFLILRTSWLFGKNGNNFPAKVLKRAEAGTPLKVVSDQIGNPTYSYDLAAGTAEILKKFRREPKEKLNKIYHLANQGTVSRLDFAKAILKRRNYSPDLATAISSKELKLPAHRPGNSALSVEKMKKEFGVELREWEAGLEAFLAELFPVEGSS